MSIFARIVIIYIVHQANRVKCDIQCIGTTKHNIVIRITCYVNRNEERFLVSFLIINAFNYNINIVGVLAYVMRRFATYRTWISTEYLQWWVRSTIELSAITFIGQCIIHSKNSYAMHVFDIHSILLFLFFLWFL